MFRHSALLKFGEAVSPERIDEFHRAVREALNRIPQIAQWAAGPALALQSGGYDYALHLDFADQADFAAYKSHPLHDALVKEHIGPVVVETARIQIEI